MESSAPSNPSAPLHPTPFIVSAMTVYGNFGQPIPINSIYEEGTFIPYWWIGEGILMLDMGNGKRRGFHKADILHVHNDNTEGKIKINTNTNTNTKTKTKPKTKIIITPSTTKTKSKGIKQPFCNSSTMVLRLCIDIDQNVYKEVNIKLFSGIHGGFQMTGITSDAMARTALERFLTITSHLWTTPPTIAKFKVCMMNSNYSIGRTILRDKLYKLLVETYGLRCTFEPTIYQGVNTKFFWNKTTQGNPLIPPGICACPTQCIGEDDGYSVGACKRITISPFRTGKIIITGAQHLEQIEDAYQFLNNVFQEHMNEVLRPSDTDTTTSDTPTQNKLKSKSISVKLQSLTTPEAILAHKVRSCPRNCVTTVHNH